MCLQHLHNFLKVKDKKEEHLEDLKTLLPEISVFRLMNKERYILWAQAHLWEFSNYLILCDLILI